MDCKLLIHAVKERRSLWDCGNVDYRNRSVTRRLWSEVAILLNTTSADAKIKWQHLKDTHRREIKQNNSIWEHLNDMSFLVNTYSARDTPQNNQPAGNAPDGEHDGDYHFLMSMLPHLRKIPEGRKLQTRIRLERILIEEMEAAEEALQPSTSFPS